MTDRAERLHQLAMRASRRVINRARPVQGGYSADIRLVAEADELATNLWRAYWRELELRNGVGNEAVTA